MSDDRPAKLSPSSLLVFWGAKKLTMCAKVVSYHDWTLDQGGPDGAFISPESLSRRIGGEYAASTIAQTRSYLRRLGLRVPLQRRDGRQLGWVVTLPDSCLPRHAQQAAAMALLLDDYIVKREEWLAKASPAVAQTNGQPLPRPTASHEVVATALGGRGGVSSRSSMAESQLSSVVTESQAEKGVGAYAPKSEKRVTAGDAKAFLEELDAKVRAGHVAPERARQLRRMAGL